MSSSAGAIGAEMVAIQRKARFADITVEQWTDRLTGFIAAQPGIGDIAVRGVRPVETAAGGSNGTLVFEASYGKDGEQHDGAFVLRFLPVAGFFHRYSVAEQFTLQRTLFATGLPVPPQLWLDAEGEWLGRPGYVMQRVSGVSPPLAWRASGIVVDASPAERRRMSLSYIHNLARIHAVDWRAAGLQWLESRASGTSPIERETSWYWDALIWSGRDEDIAILKPVRDWLIANEPDEPNIVLCHGDPNFGNYLYENGEVSAVLDWEMAFLGTPECDLLFTPTGDMVIQPDVPWPEGFLTYTEMREEYERVTGRTLSNIAFYELFAAYRVAVMNLLTIKHFPPEVLQDFMPMLERGPAICMERARALGAI